MCISSYVCVTKIHIEGGILCAVSPLNLVYFLAFLHPKGMSHFICKTHIHSILLVTQDVMNFILFTAFLEYQ